MHIIHVDKKSTFTQYSILNNKRHIVELISVPTGGFLGVFGTIGYWLQG